MEIALFGGSFDPPHVGHLLAASWVLLTEPVDELWFIPVFQHPFAKPMIGSFEERISLCETAIASLGFSRARVSRAEAEVGKDGRTVDLLEHLHRLRPNDSFALVMGSDILQETAQWKSWDRVQELARIIRVQRAGHELPGLRAAVLPAVSSTDLRARLAAGSDVSGLLPLAVERALRVSGTYGLSSEAGSPLSSTPR
jgi:nicotinate-nucleotide adenylyltransferase